MLSELELILMGIALVGGVCITTIGPGGIFVTIALFLSLDIPPSTVAGTASATFIGTGLVGSAAYLHSGHLAGATARSAALYLSFASVVGASAGAQLNTVLDARLFGMLLGGFVLVTGLILLARQWRSQAAPVELDLSTSRGKWVLLSIGLLVGFPGGLLGVGGPVLAVPLMVVVGVPMLSAVALAQVQSIFIAAVATVGYALHGAIDWRLAVLVGLPLLIGTVVGWYIAQRVDPGRLRSALAVVLLALGGYLLFGGGTPAG